MNTLTDLLLGVGQPRVSHFPDLCTLLYTYLSTLDYWTKIVYYLFTQTSPVAHTSALTPTYIKSQKLPNWPISKELGLGRMLLPHWKLLFFLCSRRQPVLEPPVNQYTQTAVRHCSCPGRLTAMRGWTGPVSCHKASQPISQSYMNWRLSKAARSPSFERLACWSVASLTVAIYLGIWTHSTIFMRPMWPPHKADIT